MTTQEITEKLTTELDEIIQKQEKDILILSGTFNVTAKHIEGTQLCSIELPCKYKDKNLTIVVYEEA
jgi:hypothetical protein